MSNSAAPPPMISGRRNRSPWPDRCDQRMPRAAATSSNQAGPVAAVGAGWAPGGAEQPTRKRDHSQIAETRRKRSPPVIQCDFLDLVRSHPLIAGRPCGLEPGARGGDSRVFRSQAARRAATPLGIVQLAPLHVDQADADERVGEHRDSCRRRTRNGVIASPGRPTSSRIDPIHKCGSSVTGS